MKKATLKTYLITLLVLLLCFTLTLALFACKNTDEPEDEETETTESDFESLVSNGDFSSVEDGDEQPYTPKSWSTYTPDGYSSDDKVAGVVDTGADYAKNSSAWGDAANPFGAVTDNKVLMIYNKEPNVYGYYGTFSTSAGYYKLAAKIKVVAAEGGGATFRITSDNGFEAFENIAASDAFTTYTFYIVAPSINSATIKVYLQLGSSQTKVKGYAFFDDVVAEKITEADYNAAVESSTVKCVSMLYPDGEFNYYTYSSSQKYQSPTSWSIADGNTSSDEHKLDKIGGKSATTNNLKKGVVTVGSEEDWDQTEYGAYPGLPVADSEDKDILYLAANKASDGTYTPSTFYYYANNKVRIDLASLYEISVWVKATVDTDDSVLDYSTKGARVVLKGTDDYSSAVVNTTNSTENGGWVKVTFYVLGNQVANKDFEVQLWLGDDESSATLTQGIAYFDKLTVEKLGTFSEDQRATVKAGKQSEADLNNYVKVIDLVSVEDDLIANNNFETLEGYDFAGVDDVKINDEKKDVIVKIITKADLDSAEWTADMKTAYGIDSNPKYPYTFAPVLIVNNTIPTAYEMKTTDLIDIEQSQCYRLSVWMKTMDLEKDAKVTLRLLDEEGEKLSSFEVNTAEYKNEFTNDYVEYSFYIKGALPVLANSTTNTNKVRVAISNGSGSTYDPSGYKTGAFLVANINMEKVTYTEYNSASTGDYVAKQDFAENDATVTNGNFNSYDLKNTEIDETTGFVKMKDEDGNTHLTASASNWTNNVKDGKYGTTKVEGDKTISKNYEFARNDASSHDVAELVGKEVTTIRLTNGGFNKTFETDSEWNKYLTIDTITNKISWASTSNNTTTSIDKTEENNGNNSFTVDFLGKGIKKITMSGPDNFSKTLSSAAEWEKYFLFDENGKATWADTAEVAALANGNYPLTITMLTWKTFTTNSNDLKKTAENNGENSFTLDALLDKSILKVTIVGKDEENKTVNKTLKTAADWEKYISVDAEGKVTWAESAEVAELANGNYTVSITTDIPAGDYTVAITYDEIQTSDLIAGIINTKASGEYLAQFGLTAEEIYDQWSASASDDTKEKSVAFGAPNLLMLSARIDKDGLGDEVQRTIKLKNTYVDEKAKNDMTDTPAMESSSFSLDGSAYYLLKCYAKSLDGAIGQVYVTTTSTDAPLAYYTVKDTNGWVEYNFLVETGLSSVSATFELYYGEKGDGDTAYTGTLLFDSFSYKKLEEDAYKTLSASEDTAKAKFTTITFDKDTAKDTAVAPTGFNAANSSAKNDDTQVSGIIAKNNFTYEKSDGTKTLGIYETRTETDEDGNETTKDVLIEGSDLSAEQIFTDAGMENGATVGDYVLMINNRKATYQTYSTNSLSLEADSYYCFSAYVRTAKVAKDAHAKVYVTISDEPISFEVNTEYNTAGEAIENKWQKLTFYFKNEDSNAKDATLSFELGENNDDDEATLKGYLFIDNVSLSKITEEEYTAATANNEVYEKDESGEDKLDANGNKVLSEISKEYRLSNIVTVLKETEKDDEDDGDDTDETKEKSSLNTTLLWTYITSIVIAVILIAVIVILLVKKYRPKKGAAGADKKTSYDRENAKPAEKEETKKTGTARDEYKD